MGKKLNFKSWLIQVLRRASYKWPARSEVLRLARIERGRYRCNMCGLDTFRTKEVNIDHIQPVIPVDQTETDFSNPTVIGNYVLRMFTDASNLQVICTTCHDAKSAQEKEMRKYYKAKVKKPLTKSKKKDKIKK